MKSAARGGRIETIKHWKDLPALIRVINTAPHDALITGGIMVKDGTRWDGTVDKLAFDMGAVALVIKGKQHYIQRLANGTWKVS